MISFPLLRMVAAVLWYSGRLGAHVGACVGRSIPSALLVMVALWMFKALE
jgi:hypothetical protein